MHEIDATLAGISTAAGLLHGSAPLSPERRTLLEGMVRSETSRLHRLVADKGPGTLCEVTVDDVLQPLVERQRVRGITVRWQRSGLVALAEPDDLAEVVSVLLENAARHAPGSPVEVLSRRCGSRVEVVVSDFGPGVDAAVRTQLFQWGARHPDSPGQGIGLSSAWHLARRQRGDLRVVDTPGVGATFVIGLRAPRGVPDDHVQDAVATADAQ
jgi:signal transduction histidine kinase